MLPVGYGRTSYSTGQVTCRAERSRTTVNEPRKPCCDLLQNPGVAVVSLEPSPADRILGKGRKERQVPLWISTAREIKRWLKHEKLRGRDQPLFPNRRGGSLTRTSVAERLKLAAQKAAKRFPELTQRRIAPHVFRHSLAMHLLQAGVDISVIALWLGHESPVTTHMYVEADLAMKERALKNLQAPHGGSVRYRPPDQVLEFLQSL